MRRSVHILVSILFLFSTQVFAQIYLSPRSVGYANTFATQSRGYNVIGWNPANLGLQGNPRFSITTTLIPTFSLPVIQITNSTVSRSWIDNYIFSGKELSDADINSLLNTIPTNGLEVGQVIQYRLIAVSIKNMAFALDVELSGAQKLPRQLFNTVFTGIEFDDPVEIKELNFEMQNLLVLSGAYGRELEIPVIRDYVRETAVGGGVKLLIGGFNGKIDKFDTQIISYRDGLFLSGDAVGIAGLGGFGLAFDLGISAVIDSRMQAGISLNNFPGIVKWGLMDVQEYHYSIFKKISSSEIEDLMDADMDSVLEEAILVDSVFTGESFFSSYPGNLLVGFQYKLLENLHLFFNYRQEFSNDFYSDTTPRLSMAMKYLPLRWLPVRFGLAIGGTEKFQWGAGLGLNFAHYALDFGFSQTGGIYNSAKGFSFSMGQELIF